MNNAIIIIGTMALVTALLRFLPFIVFAKRETPRFLTYLGEVLPFAVMAMLVVYCMKDINMSNALIQLSSVGVVVILHIWKRNTLLSIVSGTLCYMLMIRFM